MKKKQQENYQIGSSTLANYVVSYIGVVIIALTMLGIVSMWQIATRMKNEDLRLAESRMHAAAEYMDKQFQNMRMMAYQLATSKDYIDSTFTSNKYTEYELVQQFGKLYGCKYLSFYAFLKYEKYENIVTSEGKVKPIRVYLRNLLGEEYENTLDLIEQSYRELNQPLIVSKRTPQVCVCIYPLNVYSAHEIEGSVLVFVLQEKELLELIESFTGKITGELALYYDNALIYGEESLEGTITAVSESGAVKVVYQPDEKEYFSFENIFSVKEWLIIEIIVIVAALIAFVGAWRSYLPIRSIDTMLESLLMNGEKQASQLKEQYQMLREQMLRLIVKGGYSERMRERLTMLNLHLQGEVFCVFRCMVLQEVKPQEQMTICSEIEELSDDGVNLYAFWDEENTMKVLVAVDEEYQVAEASEAIGGLLEANGLSSQVEQSTVFRSLEEITRKVLWTEKSEEVNPQAELKKAESREGIASESWSHLTVQALECIEKNYANSNFGIDCIAKELNITGVHLSRLVKSQTGVSCKEHLLRMRMNAAKEMLKNTDLSIAEVCEKSGYASVSYFIKVFQKEEGTTPAKYRLQSRQTQLQEK